VKRDGPKNIVASVQSRLVQRSRDRPLALTREFGDDPQKVVQWTAFVRRTRRPELNDLSAIVGTLERFLWPTLQAARREEPWERTWTSGGPWSGR
jgi:hypothetical protein